MKFYLDSYLQMIVRVGKGLSLILLFMMSSLNQNYLNAQCSTSGTNPTPVVPINLDGCSFILDEANIGASWNVSTTAPCLGSPIYFDDDNDPCNTPPVWGGLFPSLSITDPLPGGMGLTCGATGSVFITFVNNGDPCTGGHAPPHELNFTLVDPTPPAIICPADESVVACDASVPSHPALGTIYPMGTGFAGTVSDNCDIDRVEVTAVVSNGPTAGCVQSEIIVVTYTAFDICGNSADCDQTWTYADATAPTLTCPIDYTRNNRCNTTAINPNDGPPISTTLATVPIATFLDLRGPGPTATDDCSATADLTAMYSDVITGDACATTFTRTWVISDECGNTAECVQVILYQDITPPDEMICPAPIVATGCDENDIPAPNPPFSSTAAPITAADFEAIDGTSAVDDKCTADADLIMTYTDVILSALCPTLIERTFSAEDECGNVETCTQMITINDLVAPSITCPPNPAVVEGCGVGDIVPTATALPFTTAITPITLAQFTAEGGSLTDDCPVTITYADDESGNCNVGPVTITRTFTVTDECGNEATCDQIILFDDTTDPVITCPADLTVEGCDQGDLTADGTLVNPFSAVWTATTEADALTEGVSVVESCGFNMEYMDEVLPSIGCPAMIRRFYRVIDDCNNRDACNFIITITESVAPVVTCPDDITVEGCGLGDITSGSTALAYSEVAVVITEAQFLAEEGSPAIVEDCSFEIEYVDAMAGTCPIVVTRLFTVTDDCGNVGTCTQVINVNDPILPTITCPTYPAIEGCSTADIAALGYLPFSAVSVAITEALLLAEPGSPAVGDNCNFEVSYIDVMAAATPACPANIDVSRTFTVEDECGNIATCTVVIEIRDTTAPVAACDAGASPYLVDATCSVTVFAVDLNDSSSDNCTIDANLTFGVSKTAAGPFTPSVLLEQGVDFDFAPCPDNVDLFLQVTDECGNVSTCMSTVQVNDEIDPVAVCPAVQPTLEIEFDYVACEFTTVVLPANSLGDGSSTDNCSDVTETNFAITYDCDNLGLNQVTLFAEDECGNTNSTICDVLVILTQNPVEWCNPELTCTSDLPLDLTSCVTNPDAINCGFWTGDDVSLDGIFNPSAPGSYSVTFNITTANGCSEFLTRDIDVAEPPMAIVEDLHIECTESPTGIIDLDGLFSSINETAMGGTWSIDGTAISTTSYPYNEAGCYCFEYTFPEVIFSTCGSADCVPSTTCPTPAPITACVLVSEQPEPSFDIQDQVCWSAGDPVSHIYAAKCNSPEYSAAYDSEPGWTSAINWSIQSGPATVDALGNVAITGTGNVMVCKEEVLTYPDCGSIIGGTCEEEFCVQIEVSDGTTQDASFVIDLQDQCTGTTVNLTAATTGGEFTGVGVVDGGGDGTGTVTIPADDCSAISVTYTLNDPNGCTSSYTALVHPDRVAPVVTTPAANIIVECDGIGNITDLANWLATNGGAVATDDCGVDWTFDLIAESDLCTGTSGDLYEFTATDPCGNTATTLALFIIQDTAAPVLSDMPADEIFTCSEDVTPVPVLTVTDVCDPGIALEFSEVLTPGGCEDNFTLTRTWNATDACGNTTTHTQIITVDDTELPVIVGVEADAVGQCSEDVPPVPNVTATDNCSQVILEFSEELQPGGCEDNFTIVRTWIATDACGNVATETQTIVIEDTTVPVFAGLPVDEVHACSEDVPAVANVTATDNCTEVDFDFNEIILPGTCPNDFTVTRTWTATDQCGNTVSHVQTIRVEDTEAPIITGVEPDFVGQCSEEVPPVVTPTVSDNCGDEVILQFNEVIQPGSCDDSFTLIRTWTAEDDCGNIAVESQTIVISDDTDPVVTPPAPIEVDCIDISNTASPAAIIDDFLASATATDNCSEEIIITHDLDLTGLNVCDASVITVTFTATDECGNIGTSTSTITVIEDTEVPVLIVPAPIILDCADISNTAGPSAQIADFLADYTATDNCDSDVEVTHDFDVNELDVCAAADYDITVTFTAVDNCDNETVLSSTITVEVDDTPPVLVVPTPIVLDCGDISNTTGPSAQIADFLADYTATDDCDTDVEVTHDFDDVDLDVCAAADYDIVVTFTAVDNCDNETILTSTITVEVDDTPPVLVVPTPIVLDCGDISNTTGPSAQIADFLAGATATDDCDTDVELTHDFDVTDLDVCAAADYDIVVTFTAVDNCDNETILTSTITVEVDDTPPVLVVPAPIVLDCGDISNTTGPSAQIADFLADYTATDDCDTDVEVTHDFDDVDLDVCAAADYDIVVTFTAVDNCDNETILTSTITVEVDDTPPVLVVPAPIVLDCGDISNSTGPSAQIADFLAEATATDDCDTDVELTHDFDDVELDVCAAADYDIVVTFTAVDNCDNETILTSTITVEVDDTPPVLVVPAPIVLTCADISATTSPAATVDAFLADYTATDDCDTDVEVTHDFDITTLDVCAVADYDLTVTFTAVDNCDNETILTSTITVIVDTGAPVLDQAAPADETVMCGALIPDIPVLTFSDDCNDPIVDFSEVIADLNSANEVIITRTWVATDFCGNQTVVVQVITVEDAQAPMTVICPVDIAVGTDDGLCGALIAYDIPTFTDNCETASTIGTLISGQAPNTEFPIGITEVTYTFFDDAGNEVADPCTFTVTVTDDENPVFVNCQMNETIDVFTNDCETSLTWDIPNATDNCEVTVAQTGGPVFGTLLPPGTYPIEYTATDGEGLTDVCSFTINVIDTENPVLSCPDQSAITVKGTNVDCTFLMGSTDFDATFVENCVDLASLTHDYTSGTSAAANTLNGHTFPLGNTTVTWTAIDVAGNSTTCSFEVTVEDDDAPTFECPTALDIDGCAGTVPDLIGGLVGDDNCSSVTFTQIPVAGQLFGPNSGDTVDVTITATDDAGNEAACTVVLTIVDNEMPVFLDCPLQTITVGTDTDQCGAYVNWETPVVYDNCDLPLTPTQISGPVNGTTLDVGMYTVVYEAIDADGNTATCTFDIEVVDTQCPWLMAGIPVDVTLNCEEAATFEPFVMTSLHLMDNCTDPVTDIENLYMSGQGNDPSMCDFYTYDDLYTWIATDDALNSCNWKQVVSYEDVDAPVYIASSIDLAPTVECMGPYVPSALDCVAGPFGNGSDVAGIVDYGTGVPEFVDNCAAPEFLCISLVEDFDDVDFCGFTGVLTRTWTATDPCGNVSDEIVQIITIEDTTAPVLTDCDNEVFELDANGVVIVDVTSLVTVTEECSDNDDLIYTLTVNGEVVSTGGSEVAFDCSYIGANEATLVVTDDCGNNSLPCEFILEIQDNIAPSLTCPADIVIGLEGGECEEYVIADAIVTDNCSWTIVYDPPVNDFFPIGVTVVTATVTDAGGNVVECTFNVEIVEYVPQSNTLACNDAINLSLDGNCEAVLTADMILEGNDYACYEDYCIDISDENGNLVGSNDYTFGIGDIGQTFTVMITDCLGDGNTCWGTVTIEEKFQPEIQCPNDVSIACNVDPEARYVLPDYPLSHPLYGQLITGEAFLLNCEVGAVISYGDVFTDFGQCASPRGEVVRTWTVEDASGNVATCDQVISINTFSISDVVFPGDFTSENGLAFECSDVALWPELVNPFGYSSDEDELDECELSIGRDCGGTGYPTLDGEPLPTNGGLCMFSMNIEEEIYEICESSYEIIRTWKVRNMCQDFIPGVNPIEHIQVIKVLDTQGPILHDLPEEVTVSVNPWSCKYSNNLPVPNLIGDVCGKAVSFDVHVLGGGSVEVFGTLEEDNISIIGTGLPLGESYIVYEATDGCSNTTTEIIKVTAIDDTPPTAIALENIVISLTSGAFDEDGTAKLFTTSVDNGSHDGDCGDVYLEIRRPDGSPSCDNIGNNGYNNNLTFNNNGDQNDNNNDTDGGEFVKFCCSDLEGAETYLSSNGAMVSYVDSLPVILRVWDLQGNANETWAYVRLESKLPPVIVCPPDASIDCDMDWSLHLDGPAAPTEQELAMLTAPDFGTGVATGAGVCGGINVTYEDRYNEDLCYERNNEITRTWCITGTNICCDQKIDIVKVGAFDPSTISWNSGFPEEEITLGCLGEDPMQEPSWTEAPCDLIAWTVATDTFYIEGNAADFGCIKVVNDYTVVDWCNEGQEYTFTQVIKVIDNDAPELVVPDTCIEVGASCDANVTLCATADDMGECDSPWLKWEVLVDLYGDWSYDHIFSSYVSPLDPNFGTGVNEYYIPASAPGDQVCIDLPLIVEGSKYEHRAIWKVSDGCGNFTSVTETFLVTDKKAPTPYCYSVSSALMTDGAVELWACDFVIGGEDNCTPLDWMRYTFTAPTADGGFPDVVLGDTNCESRTFTCDDIEVSNVIPVDVYTWDECDNYALCTVELTLTPIGCEEGDSNGFRIAGSIGTELDEMLEGVTVSVTSNQPEYPITIMTDDNGDYLSTNNLSGVNYFVSPTKDDDHRNGVSTLDILLIQRHLLNIQSLTSPYQYISADANNDKNITAADMVDIRKLILQVYNEFPNNESWRFVDAKQQLTTANAFAFGEVVDIMSLSNNMLDEDFIANKIGDVNNSVVLNANGSDVEIRTGSLDLNLTGVRTAEGISVDVTSTNFSAIAGYQFTLNTNGLELTDVVSGAVNMGDDNLAVLDQSTVTMSWNSIDAISVADEVLFTMNFAGSNIDLVDGIEITSEVTAAEAYDADLSVLSVSLNKDDEGVLVLGQNEPNPFTSQTVIDFSLPRAGSASLTIFDVSGKIVKQITEAYPKGHNSIVLESTDLLTTGGVLTYKLEFEEYSETKRMLLVK